MQEGLHPLHYGFELNDSFFPPSEFAIAWVGVKKPGELERILEAETQKARGGDYAEEDIPLFCEYSRNKDFGMQQLREMAKRRFGTAKLLDRTALLPVNRKGQLGTLSAKEQLSMRVESRRKGQKQRAYEVSLYSPLIREPVEAHAFRMESGSLHARKSMAKAGHWSKGLAHEEGFVRGLAALAEERFQNSPYRIKQKDVIEDYNGFVYVSDYTRAAAMTGLHQIVRQGRTELVKGLQPGEGQVMMPFDFDPVPRYAFEALLRLLHKKGDGQRLYEIDSHLVGRKGFVTPLFRTLLGQGAAKRGVLVKNKKMTGYSWAVIQAWEQHCYMQGRRFAGYALEFPGTAYQTHSIVLDDDMRDLSVRILYDGHFQQPYIMYKDFSPAEGFRDLWRLGSRDPAMMVNLAKDIHNRRYPLRQWVEDDHRTGKRALCIIREPTLEIRELAGVLSEKNGFTGISADRIRRRYIDTYFSRRAD